MEREVNKIYLHWTGTPTTWAVPGSYHTVIDGKGEAKRLTPYSEHQGGSTYNRNTNAISIAIACMAMRNGEYVWPTEKQIDGICKEVAKVALGLGWKADKNFLLFRIMTHAEAAANRDYPRKVVEKFSNVRPSGDWDHAAQKAGLPHANYSITNWFDGWPGGDVVRWDLSQLRPTDEPGRGGYEIRDRVVEWMKKIKQK